MESRINRAIVEREQREDEAGKKEKHEDGRVDETR